MANPLTEGAKTLLLAGLGAAALAVEKSAEVLDVLVEKGHATAQKGAVLNEELKRSCKEQAARPKKDSTPEKRADDILAALDALPKAERGRILARLNELDAE